MASKIIMSRKWSNPLIEAFYTGEEVGASVSVSDFIDVLVDEVGNPTMLLTKAQLKAKLTAGWLKLEKELKDTTRYI